MATARAPLKTSPAAVVSTALTVGAGISSEIESVETYEPFAPIVITTILTPFDFNISAALFADSILLTLISVSSSVSVSFGVITCKCEYILQVIYEPVQD